MKKLLKLLFHRCVVVAIGLLLQVFVIVATILGFNEYFMEFYWVCIAFSILAVLWIIGSKSNPAYKIAWIIPILVFPIFGGLFYLLFGGSHLGKRTKKKMSSLNREMQKELSGDFKAESLASLGEEAVLHARYLERSALAPAYGNTETKYFPSGEQKFEAMLAELKKAKKYIFLEYFIVEAGEMWDTILELLLEKARSGVEVRMIYDDVGCLFTLPNDYAEALEEAGIHCMAFNRFVPILTLRLNNRDHRKLMVIDGKVGFTGGINLADEYINRKVRYGHWKDGGILLRGDAVWSMTVMFLSMWHLQRDEGEDMTWFRPERETYPDAQGYAQPYTDSPLDEEPVGQTVYLNLINRAKEYVYIMTPYLIIDDAMTQALVAAAKSGVDVRIMTPHIPDKKIIFEVTRAHYEALLEDGVKIYEYTPGFCHAKTFAVDDRFGVAGTVNLDYRSLFLHFEDGVLLFGQPSVLEIKEDFLTTQECCQRITLEECRALPWWRQLLRDLLRIFAPLM